jgi:hypothetical protein
MARKGRRGRQRHAHTVLVEYLNVKGHFKVVDVRIAVNLILKK